MIDLLAVFVVIGLFSFGIFVWTLCRVAAKPAPKPTLADMLARTPKILRTNTGRRIYAEGRPTIAGALCRVAAKPTPKPDRDKILLNALNKTLDDYHAKRGTFAEGRPTMPSEGEPELEMERRTR